MSGFSALVLAGSRPGPDPVAQVAGVATKVLATVGGKPMLTRVIAALRAAGATRIAVAASHPQVVALARSLGCEVIEAADGPSESAGRGFALLGAPMLLTTADHALLEGEWITDFRAAIAPQTDVAVLLARRDVVEAAVPDTRRTWLRFADGQWSGCNLFHFATRARRRPFRCGRRSSVTASTPGGSCAASALAAAALSGRAPLARRCHGPSGPQGGVVVEAVASPHGLAAVDVDKPDDLILARRIAGQ
jgi:GTP:adenosylcobinamide-phosphate guanylyltransferase